MFRIIPDTNINFIGARKTAFVVSLCLVALGIFAFVMISTGHAPMGIDFAGGAKIQGYFENPVQIDELRAALGSLEEAKVTEVTDFEFPNAFIIKSRGAATDSLAKARGSEIESILAERFPDNSFTSVGAQSIGPSVGEQLRKDARWAIIVSFMGIIAYIWIRFDFRSGVAATVATFHDVLAVLGMSYLLGLDFDLLIVTALLTLAGYSLTDTVVVFDRIRENLRKFRGRGEFVSAVNTSINEVLGRTFNTSMTTLVVVMSLLIFGGEVLRNFALALTMGVIIGTYSSIFVASPIVVEWEARRPRLFK
jgi:preprotein translocase subunit SecF